MKMTYNIETEHNIGDIVYSAYLYYELYAIQEPYVINDIVININNRGIRVMYCIEQNGRTEKVPEDWIFDTYEECTKWCKERNKSL
jgi:hypothetical protein